MIVKYAKKPDIKTIPNLIRMIRKIDGADKFEIHLTGSLSHKMLGYDVESYGAGSSDIDIEVTGGNGVHNKHLRHLLKTIHEYGMEQLGVHMDANWIDISRETVFDLLTHHERTNMYTTGDEHVLEFIMHRYLKYSCKEKISEQELYNESKNEPHDEGCEGFEYINMDNQWYRISKAAWLFGGDFQCPSNGFVEKTKKRKHNPEYQRRMLSVGHPSVNVHTFDIDRWEAEALPDILEKNNEMYNPVHGIGEITKDFTPTINTIGE